MQTDRESCEVLRAAARSADADEMHRVAVGVRDWNSLLELAHGHRVLPLIWSRLADTGSAVPLIVQERLRAEYERNVLHNMANAAELIALLKALEHEGISAMPIKGVVLGASIYGDFTARSAGDLDVLIHYGDRKRAMGVVLDRGFELKMPVDAKEHEYHFERQADGMVVELCWRMRLNRFMQDLGMDWAWPRRQVTMVAGAEVPDMSIEMTLLMLCVHGSKHVWSRLIWTYDVAQLLASSPGLDWSEVMLEAKRSGLRRCLAVGVLLAHRVAGAAIPEAVLRGFEADATASRLASYFAVSMFDAPGSTPKGWLPYGMQMLDLRDRVRMLWPLDWLGSNERDEAAV